MRLSDRDIRREDAVHHLVRPVMDLSLLGPSSYDVRLGTNLAVEIPGNPRTKYMVIDLTLYTEERPFYLMPGDFALSETAECFFLPPHMEGTLSLRSTWARAGLNHSLAGKVDPGWLGVLTLELKNVQRFHPIGIYTGARIAQLTYDYMASEPLHDYSTPGHVYYGATTVEGPNFTPRTPGQLEP